MAKMRVHELAKELNIKSQDIIETLSGTDYAVKSASSGIEDEAQKVVRNNSQKKMSRRLIQSRKLSRKINQQTDQRKNQVSQLYLMPSTVSRQESRLQITASQKRVVQIMDREQQIRVETEREITHSHVLRHIVL